MSLAALSVLAALAPSLALAEPLAYVTNQSFNQVNVFRTSDWVMLGSIPVGAAPTGISIPPVGGFAYTANRAGNSVSKIDLATNAVTNIPVPGNPTAVTTSLDGTRAYVVQSTNCPPLPTPTPPPVPTPTPIPGSPTPTPTPPPPCTVAVIDTAANAVVGSVTVGHDPFDLASSPSGGFVYVSNRGDDNLSIIDTSTNLVVGTTPVGKTPEGLAVGSGEIYVANDAIDTVTVVREVDMQKIAEIPVGGGPLGIGLAPDGKTAVVSNDTEGTVSLLATGTHTESARVPSPSHPAGIAYLPDSTKAVIANNTGNSISVLTLLDGSVLTIPMLGSPTDVAITPEPFFELTKVATPFQVPYGGTVEFDLSLVNRGSGVATNVTLTDAIPDPDLTLTLATGGGAQSGTNVVWNFPTVGVGQTVGVQAFFTVGTALFDGTLLTNVATVTDTATPPHTAEAEAQFRVRAAGSLDLSALYKKTPPDKPARGVVRAKTQFQIPNTFDGSQAVNVTMTTPTQLLFQMSIPAGQLVNDRRGKYQYSAKLATGEKLRFTLAPQGGGLYIAKIQGSKLNLPVANSVQIRVTVDLGVALFTTERVFEVRRAPPGGQRLFYKDSEV